MIKSLLALILFTATTLLLIIFADFGEERVYVISGNKDKEPLEIVLEKYFCSQDNVPIKELFNTAQAIKPNGDTHFFNDLGSAFLWFHAQPQKENIALWVYAKDTERYVLAKSAWYSRVEVSPMGYGFGAYEYHLYGVADYYFDEVQQFALRGETLWHPMVRFLLSDNKL